MEWTTISWIVFGALTLFWIFTIKYVMKKRNWHWTAIPSAGLMLFVGLTALTRENKWHSVFFFGMAGVILVQWWWKKEAH